MVCPHCEREMLEQAAYVVDRDHVEVEVECQWCGVTYSGVLIKTRSPEE